MHGAIHIFTFAALVALVKGSWFHGSSCRGSEQPCLQSSQCCEGFVCVAYPQDRGSRLDYLGQCIKEKDERFCQVDADCPGERTCVRVGALPDRDISMCVENVKSKRWYHYNGGPVNSKPFNSLAKHKLKGLGDECRYDDECSEGKCCQRVTRVRRRPRYLCGPIKMGGCKGDMYQTNEVYDLHK